MHYLGHVVTEDGSDDRSREDRNGERVASAHYTDGGAQLLGYCVLLQKICADLWNDRPSPTSADREKQTIPVDYIVPDRLWDAEKEVGGGPHPSLPQQRSWLHIGYRCQCDRNWCSIVTGTRQGGMTHSLCKSGAEQVGGKLQCDKERAVGSSVLLQIFPALPYRKKVQATHRSHRPEVVADL